MLDPQLSKTFQRTRAHHKFKPVAAMIVWDFYHKSHILLKYFPKNSIYSSKTVWQSDDKNNLTIASCSWRRCNFEMEMQFGIKLIHLKCLHFSKWGYYFQIANSSYLYLQFYFQCILSIYINVSISTIREQKKWIYAKSPIHQKIVKNIHRWK